MLRDVFVLSAPSGAGKTSLAKALVESLPGLGVAVSHTTRTPRPGEQDGVHYHFVTHALFEDLIAQGAFLEYAHVFDHIYGTSREALAAVRRQGRGVLLDIDWQGARRIKTEMPSAVTVFILPPSIDALKARLKGRAQDHDEVVERRMREAASEISHYPEFDHLVVNDDFERALADIKAVIRDGAPLRVVPPELPALLLAGAAAAAGKAGEKPLT
ncbi:MAG: guanylate kinase [Acidiferrobacteraceae bacterium]